MQQDYRLASLPVPAEPAGDAARWIIHRERPVDQDSHVTVSLADVELPDGTRFTQYVFRMRRCAMIAVLDEPGTSILLLRRHRFIISRQVWEVPGGYVDDGEDGPAAAVREAEEETGWRPRSARLVLSFQPMTGNADYPQDLYIATGADRTGQPAPDEAAEARWVPLAEAAAMIADGRIAGAATVIGVQHALLLRAGTQPPGHQEPAPPAPPPPGAAPASGP